MPDQNRAAFRERLGMYLLGIALGCVILGLIYTIRGQLAPRSAPPPAQTPPASSSP